MKNAKLFWGLILTSIFLGAWARADEPATQPIDPNSPKGVAIRFAKAIVSGDADAARRLVIDDPKN